MAEKEISKVVLKRIVARRPIPQGTRITEEDITVKRNDSGLLAGAWDFVIGSLARKDYSIDEGIEF